MPFAMMNGFNFESVMFLLELVKYVLLYLQEPSLCIPRHSGLLSLTLPRCRAGILAVLSTSFSY